MKVKLIHMTSNPIDVIASAFAITRGLSYEEYHKQYHTLSSKMKLIQNCYESGHMSGFEFVDIDFELLSVSRVFEADKIRSRLSSYEVEAGKFTDQRDFESVIPREYTDEIAQERIAIIRKWNSEDAAKGIDPRNRRYWTHQGLSRRMRVKTNLRSLIETGYNRLCSTTQWEYREFMALARDCIASQNSYLATLLVPKCNKLGYCPEVWEPCGKFPGKQEVLSAYDEATKA